MFSSIVSSCFFSHFLSLLIQARLFEAVPLSPLILSVSFVSLETNILFDADALLLVVILFHQTFHCVHNWSV